MKNSNLIYATTKPGQGIFFNPATCTFVITDKLKDGKILHEFTTEGYCLRHKSWWCGTGFEEVDEAEEMEYTYGWRRI